MNGKLTYCILVLAITSLLCSSCQKVISIKVDNATAQLVIEANITNLSQQQVVTISQSVPFTNTNVFPAVSGAVVSVTDNKGVLTKFTESNATKGTYLSPKFAGKIGATYTLTITLNGQTYTAVSAMPLPVNFDQLTYRDDIFNNDKLMTAHYQDPINVANQYRFVMFVNSKQVKAIFAANDSFTDGGYIDLDLFQSDISIKLKDTVSVEMQCIDKNVYTYWYSLADQANGGAGAGTTPANPPSNITNNVLGYFSAHTSQRQTLIIN